jgi:hypothetical protein
MNACQLADRMHIGLSNVYIVPPFAVAIAGFLYITPVSSATFLLDQRLVDFDTAEGFCNTQGGHLAYYTSLEEQEDVETYFLAQVGRPWRFGGCVHGHILCGVFVCARMKD